MQDANFMIMILLMLVVLFWMSWSNSRKQKKEKEKFISSISKGSKVLTAGGIHGTIVEISDKKNDVLLEIAPGVRIRIEKSMLYPSAEEAQADAANAVNADKK